GVYRLDVVASAFTEKDIGLGKDQPAFKNVVVNGIILAEDGQKMSKRLKNYSDPMDMVEKYGADSLRYYLLSSPAMRAESLNFSEKDMDEARKKVIMRLKNVLAFYKMYAGHLMSLDIKCPSSENVLDKWILARLNILTNEITKAMDDYELDRAVRPVADFIDDLSTWYIRRSRERFKSEKKDKNNAISTTQFVLTEFSKLIAPIMPFVAEEIYQALKKYKESVHLEEYPESRKLNIENSKILEEMKEIRNIVVMALEQRAKSGIKVRQPLQILKINSAHGGARLKISDELLNLIKDEINVKEVVFAEIENEIELDTEITDELRQEGVMRELTRNIQDLRKKSGLKPQDKIEINIETDKNGEEIIKKFKSEIKKLTSTDSIKFSANNAEELKINELIFKIEIKK
ncbi:class I tRNA ligase family protein, partial [Patescibacteria group bacterium]|nr:class I tRNA ligase family protein [Patescibacteria group bacterium]